MVTPNQEQKAAIEHSGGVLLEAGAGAGKTFVIINHLIYYFKQKQKQKEINLSDLGERKNIILEFLSSIVVCTFTKEAAGELKKRLNLRIDEEIYSEVDDEIKSYWITLKEALTSLNIGTIHSFLYNLVRLGLIPGLNHNSQIITQLQWEEKIRNLVTEIGFKSDVLTESEALTAMLKIFSNPLLRLEWDQFNLSEGNPEVESQKIHDKFFQLMDESGISIPDLDLSCLSDQSTKKWYLFIQEFQSVYSTHGSTFSGMSKVADFFSQVKRMPVAPRQEELNYVKEYLGELKKLKKFLISFYEEFTFYIDHFDFISNHYLLPLKELYSKLGQRYLSYPGIVFSDLEYYVQKALSDSSHLRQSLQESYQYFIIDEFQDTSNIQMDIVLNIVGQNYEKLFCVGDPKQAIYGFRGGELAVFESCKNSIPQLMSLKMNYRSVPGMVDFNNQFFYELLALGQGYENVDKHTVEFTNQKTVDEYSEQVNKSFELVDLKLSNIDEFESLKSDQINTIESQFICARIMTELEEESGDIAVLYKKLAPANYLMNLLIEKKISFQSIVKIPFADEPIIGIHFIVSRFILNQHQNVELTCLYIQEYLKYYDKELSFSNEEMINLIEDLEKNINYLNLSISFRRFFSSFGVSSSKIDLIGATLNSLYSLARNSLEELYRLLQNMSEVYQKSTLAYGSDPRVFIMTAHASKGLEFDTVFLGGVSTNAKTFPDQSKIGLLPQSIKWKLNKTDLQYFTSPNFLLEKTILKNKDFSESKRLLYVANTRAKKKLIIAQISEANSLKLRIDKNSWINAFKRFQEINSYQFSQTEFLLDFHDESNLKKSYFHTDRRSLVNAPKQVEVYNSLMPELSVTKLTSFYDCPRKFYFNHILKIDQSLIPGEKQIELPIFDSGDNQTSLSNLERGSTIHAEIEEFVKEPEGKEKFSSEVLTLKQVQWLEKSLIQLKSEYKLLSEYEIKFPFFDHMISGTIDLVALSDNEIIIIDFKTGRMSEQNLEKYFAQLKLYAFGLDKLKIINLDFQVELKIISIDTQENFTKAVTRGELEGELLELFKALNNFDQVNLDSCQYCDYLSICDQVTDA